MLYFQVLPESDQVRKPKSKTCGILVKDELYTPNEVIKLGVSPKHFKLVTVPKQETYFFFGSRFSSATNSEIKPSYTFN